MEWREILTILGAWTLKTQAVMAAKINTMQDRSILYLPKAEKMAMHKIIVRQAMEAAGKGDFGLFEIHVGIAEGTSWWIMFDHDKLYEREALSAVLQMEKLAKIVLVLEGKS